MDKKTKKKEALKRMSMLELDQSCINAFKNNDDIWISETEGMLYDLSQRPEIKTAIEEIENNYGMLVYHGILTPTEFGILISLFYVSDEKDEWELDYEDMQENYACCYVINLDDDACSEIGSIQYKKMNGGLVRVA